MCGRQNQLDILPISIGSYRGGETNLEWQHLVTLECRGLEPTDFDPRVSRFDGWVWHSRDDLPLVGRLDGRLKGSRVELRSTTSVSLIRSSTVHKYLHWCVVVLTRTFSFQDWCDYDEKAKVSVGIYEWQHKFVRG